MSARPRTKAIVTTTASVLAAIALLRLAAGCLDITPIVVPPREASAIIPGEPCRTCIERACSAGIAKCVGDPRCDQVYECMVAGVCLDHVDLTDKINCTLPCLTDAGISSVTDDPTVDTLVSVVQCGQDTCAVECNLGDGGVGLDAF